MIVDRELALVGSNNIMDNDNTEMLVQYEGAIVDSIWDTFIVSWHKALDPPPPYLNEPATGRREPSYMQQSFLDLFDDNGAFRLPETQDPPRDLPPHLGGDPHFDEDVAGEIRRLQCMLAPKTPGQGWQDVIASHLSMLRSASPTSRRHADGSCQTRPHISTSRRLRQRGRAV